MSAIEVLLGVGVVIGLFARPASAADGDIDVMQLQTAVSLELLTIATYQAALTLPFIKDGNPVIVAFDETTMMQHDEHRQAFSAQTQALGGTDQTAPNPKYTPIVEQAKPSLTAPIDVVTLGATLEQVATETYLDNLNRFTDVTARVLTASVMGVECQHLATLRAVGALIEVGAPELIKIPLGADLAKLPAAAGSVAFRSIRAHDHGQPARRRSRLMSDLNLNVGVSRRQVLIAGAAAIGATSCWLRVATMTTPVEPVPAQPAERPAARLRRLPRRPLAATSTWMSQSSPLGLKCSLSARNQAALDAAGAGSLGDVPPAVGEFVTVALAQHQEHLDAWNSVITGAGEPAVTEPNATLKPTVDTEFAAVTDVEGGARLALLLEQIAAATYLSAQSVLSDPAAIELAGSIQVVDAQHAAVLLYVLGEYPVPDVFGKVELAVAA